MRLSVIIPAYNEEELIGEAIESIKKSLEKTNMSPYEIIVADDDSTDHTVDMAREHGAKVIRSGKRNIGATRNVGASIAQGEYVLFVDADSQVTDEVMRELETVLDEDIVGGGAMIRWSHPAKYISNVMLKFWLWLSKRFQLPAGSFFFVRRDTFEKVQGFDEEFYVSEELQLAKKLKHLGQLKILDSEIMTSPRKVHQFSNWEFLKLFFFAIFLPRRILRNRKYLDIWYKRRK